VRAAVQAGIRIAVPTAVVAETWRGGARSARASALLAGDSCDVEDLTQVLARATGTALGLVRGAGAVDAMVMAHAAVRGDVVMTADERDLDRLRQCDALRAVRLLKV
jgi:predicted nucleic acid-binding protein